MASPKPRWGGAPSDKCTECGKTVYPAEKLVMEGRIFHIKCLRCQDELCNKLLTGANWGGFMPPDDKPYCKIHFDRLVISSGKGGVSSTGEWKPKENTGSSSPSQSRWGGAPSDKCVTCGKTVYPAEKLVMEGKIFHAGSCLKCSECDKYLTGANWGGFVPQDEGEDKAYCKTHLNQLVAKSGGATALHSAATWTPKTSSTPKDPNHKPRWGGAPADKCERCGKTVYPAEKVSMEGRCFHAPCLRCVQCNKQLTGANFGNFVPPDNEPYCRVHYEQIIARIGDATKLSGSHLRE